MTRFLSLLSRAVEGLLDFLGSLPDALATFLMALATVLGVVAAIALAIGLGFLFFSMSTVAGWVYVVLACCVWVAALWTIMEEL